MANINFGVNILPKANNTYTLGNSDYKWNIFANALNGVSLTNIITDIQINSTSILSNNVANIPLASYDDFGVIKLGRGLELYNNTVVIGAAGSAKIKAGTESNNPVVPAKQHEATFYGLAKAAGDSTQASSANSVGTYTDDAKAAIHSMLGTFVPNSETTFTDGYNNAASSTHIFFKVIYSASDVPASGNTTWVCEQMKMSSTYGWQKATTSGTTEEYIRVLTNGTWSSWYSNKVAINSHYGTQGSTTSPVTAINSIPLNWMGSAVLDSSISPSGVLRAHSIIKWGLSDTRYHLLALDQYANKIYLFENYDGTARSWKEIPLGVKAFGGTSSARTFSFSMDNADHAQVYIGNNQFMVYLYNNTIYNSTLPSGFSLSYSNGTVTITRDSDTTYITHVLVME